MRKIFINISRWYKLHDYYDTAYKNLLFKNWIETIIFFDKNLSFDCIIDNTNDYKIFFYDSEIDLINQINLLNKEDIYNYGLYVSTLAAEIKEIERKEIIKTHSELPIRSKRDIVIDGNEIASILNQKPGAYIKEILNDLELAIINHLVENKKENLRDYILSKYM